MLLTDGFLMSPNSKICKQEISCRKSDVNEKKEVKSSVISPEVLKTARVRADLLKKL